VPANPFQKRSPSGRVAVPSVQAHNAMLDAAQRAAMGVHDRRRGSLIRAAGGVVLVKNDTDQTVPRFGVLAIDGPIVHPADNELEFKQRIAIRGVVPDVQHAGGRCAVLLEPLAAGRIGRAIIDGVVQTRVTILDPTHAFADVAPGATDHLQSGTSGPGQILFASETSGTAWALVRLGPGSAAGVGVLLARIAAYAADGTYYVGYLLDASGQTTGDLVDIVPVNLWPEGEDLRNCIPRWGPGLGPRSVLRVERQQRDVDGTGVAEHIVTEVPFLAACNPAAAGDLSIDSEFMDFGDVEVGDTPTDDFTLTNNGASNIDYDAAISDLRGVNPFTITAGASGTITPSGTANVTVEFAPVARGEFAAHCTVTAGTQTIVATVRGRGIATELQITPSPLDFGVVQNGAQKTLTLTVTNVGEVSAGVTAALEDGDPALWLLESPWNPSLAQDQSATFDVTFDAPETGTGLQSGVVRFTAGGVDYDVIVRATVVDSDVTITPLDPTVQYVPPSPGHCRFRIQNNGTASADVAISIFRIVPFWFCFALDDAAVTVPASEYRDVMVYVNEEGLDPPTECDEVPCGPSLKTYKVRVHFDVNSGAATHDREFTVMFSLACPQEPAGPPGPPT